jgi:hypothetical protein
MMARSPSAQTGPTESAGHWSDRGEIKDEVRDKRSKLHVPG